MEIHQIGRITFAVIRKNRGKCYKRLDHYLFNKILERRLLDYSKR